MWLWESSSKKRVPGLQEGEKSLLEDVENCGEEESQCQEDEQFVSELPAVVLGDEFSPELNGPRHGLELLICLLDCSRGGCFKQERKRFSAQSALGMGLHTSLIYTHFTVHYVDQSKRSVF